MGDEHDELETQPADEPPVMRRCPQCGDELPAELGAVTCVRKGHHVAIVRDSVYPLPQQPPPLVGKPPTLRLSDFVVGLLTVLLFSLIIAALLRGAYQ